MSRVPKENSNLNKMNQSNQVNELEWLAFCYISDELSDLETAAFEARLENDQVAREAVANAVEQGQLVFATIKSDSLQHTQNVLQVKDSLVKDSLAKEKEQSSTRRASVLFAAAAALLLMVGSWAWMNAQSSPSVAGDTEGLAEVWGDTLASMSEEPLTTDGLILDEPEIELVDTTFDTDSEDWMFVALTEMENSLGEYE